ncbi:hypothetical protein K469DRAFT_709981 [Zopfia rhizophila CBS 207.26]|uniref:RING-type E3 ubiquitin transferase n=1 Tax=Zopfia rhizophila CBS 207.26 TaxID=1314779 RepID=A0A6A6E096_9PEZI|nr:hypothetical protein K469DRAFT_709981 [Zopfia rhizophila CBS 207.26]
MDGQAGSSSSPPDIMNDPEYATNKSRDKGEDADTCRICRGDGTPDEPLFYPCKCSGSIKFVHQECLMEWLSHSQKKYCELCKTSFRFTKLYHPHMPNRIPTSVFLRRAAVHVLKMLLTWLRGILVASVWLILLPWCMRVVWRSLFWVGDGGWTRDFYETVDKESQTSTSQPWDVETIRSAIDAAKAANTSVSLPLPTFLMPFSQTLNMSAGEPTAWSLIKRFFFGISYPIPDFASSSGMNITDLNTTHVSIGTRNPSLLSDISFFNWFHSQAANRFLIDVLEGQIITLLVVVAFILIFLIREWVVQQQPVINMVALGDNAAAEPARARAPEPVDPEPEDEPPRGEEAEEEGERVYNNPAADQILEDNEEEPEIRPPIRARRSSSARRQRQAIWKTWQNSEDIPEDLRHAMQHGSADEVARIIERMPLEESIQLKEKLIRLSQSIREGQMAESEGGRHRSRGRRRSHEEIEAPSSGPSNPQPFPERSSSLQLPPDSIREADDVAEQSSPPQRPNMPARNRSFIATEIRRSLEESNTWSFANADQVPEEQLQEHLDPSDEIPESWEDEETETGPAQKENEWIASDQEQDSEHSSESWQQISDIVVEDNTDPAREQDQSKGKGKARVSDDSSDRTPGVAATSPSEAETELLDSTPTDTDDTHPGSAPADDSLDSNASVVGSGSYRQESETEEQPLTDPEPEPVRQIARPRPGLIDRVFDWLWGDVAPGVQAAEDDANDEHIVQNLADEAPFVPFAANEPREPANAPVQDPEVAAAAAEAGIDLNDQDAIDDAEDLEGIMELIGMQGPLTGLFQNAMFSAVLISATLACAVWFPYLWGKVVLLFMGSPISLFVKLPIQFIAAVTDFIVDAALCIAAGVIFWVTQFIRMTLDICTWGALSGLIERPISLISGPARSIAESAMDRLAKLFLESSAISSPNYFRLSINSHVALRTIQNTTSNVFNQTGNAVATWYEAVAAVSSREMVLSVLQQVPATVKVFAASVFGKVMLVVSWVWKSKPYKITLDLGFGQNVTSAYTAIEQWSTTDRLIAIFAGYSFFAVVGAVYLKRAAPITTSQQGRRVEAIIADILQQAGGVLKVILIISIEMLAFPLYCGLLLDIALLPLFGNASIRTRWQFARESPWTSGFMHWFIGTCYMFHFALFVSMCRKIMRRGVLYFIRDPDDPTFHPVRDVLERSVTTQLRKIAFSALVYGALVIICLGGVVWTLDRLSTGVLPIHWASHAPSLEFPLDLLFYNFLTPLIIKVYKPSDGLHTMYKWWFKSCARLLRLSNFLFGEKVKEEEGHHVRRTWSSWFAGEKGDAEKPVIGEDRKILAEDRGTRVYFMFDGKYVRAPASDQVRIPKGEPVFIEVDQFNHRKDGKSEEGGVHARDSDMVSMVYIPPWFRVRIALFVLTIWIFAATTGVGITVTPLIFGRYLFSLFLPPTVAMNDIHAFSLGIYTLGTMIFGAYQVYKLISTFRHPLPSPLSTLQSIVTTISKFTLRILRVGYVYTSLVLLMPFLFALLLELYILIPLHAYLGPHEPHVVHLIQDWTLGFLYARLAARIIFSNRASRPARAFSAVVADGYANPNARLATRCFILPVVAIFTIAILIPSSIAWTLNRTIWIKASEAAKSQVWRFSYPSVALAIVVVWMGKEGVIMLKRWRMVVRDEVYLIGERLHNFGERRVAVGAVKN